MPAASHAAPGESRSVCRQTDRETDRQTDGRTDVSIISRISKEC